MTKIRLTYNPYKIQTNIEINGNVLPEDSILKSITSNKRLQEWIDDLPQMLVETLHTKNFEFEFKGMSLDYDDVIESFKTASNNHIFSKVDISFIEVQAQENIKQKIIEIFNDLRNGPVEEFKDPKLLKAFENANNKIFPINVIATMSAGKSTIINALLETTHNAV